MQPAIISSPDLVSADQPPTASRVNGYDLAFVRWFRDHGWCVHWSLEAVDAWTFNDAACRFRVTAGMVGRLLAAGLLEAFACDRGNVFDEWYRTPEYSFAEFLRRAEASQPCRQHGESRPRGGGRGGVENSPASMRRSIFSR